MNNVPKINLLYYKNLLDVCFYRFFDLYNNSFIKEENHYILAERLSKSKLTHIFKILIKEQLLECTNEFNILEPNYYFIIGSCFPKDNILFIHSDPTKVPKKLENIVTNDYQLKYLFKEKDIKLDMILFNQIFQDIFDDFFSNEQKLLKFLGKNRFNVVFIKHRHFDCYSMFRFKCCS
jgi:hypothetical protein